MPEPRVAARTFRDLLVWQKAHQFVLGVYSFTAAFPKPETDGLSLFHIVAKMAHRGESGPPVT